ncbi:hypothetical protein BST81_12745 [Leptolyngbya sp. 'hensonii']|uniref:hypothetical protein n=1 Tax=Leptolyngbya sp. 'hensonii' TaxID=1922337 RepID=UPI00094F573E|nr:hypothetical protein [Leptolyngbya sp. 'hensonii']OLP17920.1 hypothetical protein BST81_12745 [Leptolyngbya sp. 'hensonii']
MKKSQYFWGSLSLGVLLLAGCSSAKKSTEQAAVPDRISPAPGTSQQVYGTQPPSKPVISPSKSADQAFAKPLVKGSKLRLTSVAGLIPPTNIEERLAIVSRGRRDPFATVIPGPAVVAIQPATIKSAPVLPPVATSGRNLPQVTTVPLPTLQPNSNATGLPPVSPGIGNPTPIVVPASPTATADAIQIMGVMQTGNQLSAIVRSPEDPSGRAVKVGDYLASGRVRVKDIKLKQRNEPVVILEQNGVEIIKSVGNPVASAL